MRTGWEMGHRGDELRQVRVNVAAEELRPGGGRDRDLAVSAELSVGDLPGAQVRRQSRAIRDCAPRNNLPDFDQGVT